MDTISQICALLVCKRDYFLEYERETVAISIQEAEGIPLHVEKREHIREKIDALTQQIAELCAGDGPLQNAAALRGERGALPPKVGLVFDAAMEVRAVVNRIQKEEPQAMARIVEAREQAAGQIRRLNQGKEAAASRYRQSVHPFSENSDRGKI